MGCGWVGVRRREEVEWTGLGRDVRTVEACGDRHESSGEGCGHQDEGMLVLKGLLLWVVGLL